MRSSSLWFGGVETCWNDVFEWTEECQILQLAERRAVNAWTGILDHVPGHKPHQQPSNTGKLYVREQQVWGCWLIVALGRPFPTHLNIPLSRILGEGMPMELEKRMVIGVDGCAKCGVIERAAASDLGSQ
jgi:hypothetical protein